MKNKYSVVVLLLSLCLPFLTQAQQSKILTADKYNENGLVYTLPLTSLSLEVTAEKEVRKAGPFHQYAKRFTGADKVISEDAEIWTIKDIRVKPYGTPDPENRYLMQVKPGMPTFLSVDNNGMLLGINISPEVKSEKESRDSSKVGMPLEDNEYLQYVGEDFSSAISSFEKANQIWEALKEVREAKLALTRGTAETMPTDGRQLELMLNSLERQEAALNAAFVGSVYKETSVRTFNFLPEDEGKFVAFRMSDFAGPVKADDYSGSPVYINIRILSEGEIPVDSKGEEKKPAKDGVYYCVPGTAEITLSNGGKIYYEKNLEIAQFGFIFSLNPSLFTAKKEPAYAIFDPVTGALKDLGTVKE